MLRGLWLTAGLLWLAVAAKLKLIGFDVAMHENLDVQGFRVALGSRKKN